MKNIRLRSYKDIGSILVADGTLAPERLAEATEIHVASNIPLGRTLVELGFISEWDLARVIAKELGVPFIRLKAGTTAGAAIRKLDPSLMHDQHIFVLESFEGVDTLVITEPPSVEVMSEIGPFLADKVFLAVALISDVHGILDAVVPRPELPAHEPGSMSAEDMLKGFGD